MNLIYTFMTYFPICSAILGILFLVIYNVLKFIKKGRYTVFLVTGYVGIGLFALYHYALIFAMYLGWFPVPRNRPHPLTTSYLIFVNLQITYAPL